MIEQNIEQIVNRMKALPRGGQSRLARLTGMPISTLSEFKRRGARRPSYHMIVTLDKALAEIEQEMNREKV